MAQLIKLQDYISRYQKDLTRYPAQLIHLKKSQWNRVKLQWEQGGEIPDWEHIEEEETEVKKGSFFKRIMPKRFSKKVDEVEVEDIETLDTSSELNSDEVIKEEDPTLEFEANILYQPKTLQELKRMYMDQFFHFQMKWASSTLREKSYIDPRFLRDTMLRTVLQSLPDNYLVLYYPIIKLKKAPVELDIIIITPTECICMTVVEQENQAVFIGNSERFWLKKVGNQDKKFLNPMIQLERTEKIVKQLFAIQQVEMPIKKVLLSRNGYFDYSGVIQNLELVDKRNYEQFIAQLKVSHSPMKHMQIRGAQAILDYAQTTSFNRDIWQTPIENEEDGQ